MKHITFYSLLFLATITILGCSQTKPVTEITTEEQPTTKTLLELNVYVGEIYFQLQKTDLGWNAIRSVEVPTERAATDYIQIEPTQGWEEFQMMLDYFNILNLPNQKDIKDYKPSPTTKISRNYIFNITANNTSHSLEYTNPEADLSRSWEAQSVVSFGTYLTNEFSVVE
ncbi:MAG: hypothetical protein WC967_03350 [Balneolaceae bacterium]